MYSLLVNDVKLDRVIVEGGFRVPSFNVETGTVEIPGRPGAVKTRRYIRPFEFEIPLAYLNEYNPRDTETITNEIVDWINYTDPVKLKLTNLRWYWKAYIDGPFYIATNTRGFVTFSLRIKLADPYKYSDEEYSTSFTSSGAAVNEGTAEAYPYFKVNVNEQITNLTLTNHNNLTPQETPRQIILGRASTPEEERVEREELVMHDTMNSVAGWQEASEVDNGHITGEMAADSERGFYADRYGEVVEQGRFQGPSLIRSIGSNLQDFRADIRLEQLNSAAETGMIEVYFRDVNGNRVAKIGFEDPFLGASQNQGKARIGDHDIYVIPSQLTGWNDFDGIMRIERVGDVWRLYFAKIQPDGSHTWVSSTRGFTGVSGSSSNPITHVQVAIRIYPLSSSTTQSVKEIKMYRINDTSSTSTPRIPIIGKSGDVFEIDAATGMVMKNGEEFQEVSLNTEFFSLIEGVNALEAYPPGALSTEVTWHNRFK